MVMEINYIKGVTMSPRMRALRLALLVALFSALASPGLMAQRVSTRQTSQGCWFCGYYSCYISGDNHGAQRCTVPSEGICIFGNICSSGYPLGRSENEQLTPSGTPALLVGLEDPVSGRPVIDCQGRVFWKVPTSAERKAAEELARGIVL